MRILLINQTFYPDVTATGQYLTDLALELAKKEENVTVLTAARGYEPPHHRLLNVETYRGIHIVRVWPFKFNRTNRFLRILDAACVNAAFTFKLLQLPKFDRIVALTSPPLVGWTAAIVSRWKKAKFIYWLMDINPDEAIEAGWIGKNSLYAHFLDWVLKMTLHRSHKILCLDRYMRERIAAKAGNPSENIFILPPWAHDEELETIPHEFNKFRKEFNLEGKFVVMYAGNHSICHPLGTLLEAAALLGHDSSIQFLFIGDGERTSEVSAFKHRRHLSNITQIPYQTRSDLKFSLSAADLHAVVMGDNYVGIVHPSKIYGVLTIGRPFVYIGPPDSHVMEIIKKDGIGYETRHGQPEKLVEIIKRAAALTQQEKQEIMSWEKKTAAKFSQARLCGELTNLITT